MERLRYFRRLTRVIRRPASRRAGIVVAGLGFVAGLAIVAWLSRGHVTSTVDSFTACAEAGYPVTESNPPVCTAPSGTFTGPIARAVEPDTTTSTQDFDLLVDAVAPADHARTWQVISSQSEWQTFWHDMHRGITPEPPLIPVDFVTSDVVGLVGGPKPGGGYKLKITNIATTAAAAKVSLTEVTPRNCAVTAVRSTPYLLVRTAKLPPAVSFAEASDVHNCRP